MSKMIETLKNNGWVETTMGECRAGDEVLVIYPNGTSQPLTVARVIHEKWAVEISDGSTRRGDSPVFRSPRPEYAPGTVALVSWDEWDDAVRNLLPVRAMMSVEGVWHGVEIDPPGESDRIEVVRVLLPADQDTPPITDEMVERGAEACYLTSNEKTSYSPQWDEVCEKFPIAAARYRQEARATLGAALENEKEK